VYNNLYNTGQQRPKQLRGLGKRETCLHEPGRVAHNTLRQLGAIDVISAVGNAQAQVLNPSSTVLGPAAGSLTVFMNMSQVLSLIPIIRKHILLNSRLKRLFSGKQIEIERDIYNGLFHTAFSQSTTFSQSRNNIYDLSETKDQRRLFTTTLPMIIVKNDCF
jgi:hypothetical protein